MSTKDLKDLVLDMGSGMMKVGFGCDHAPRAYFPSMVWRPKNPGIMVGMDAKDCFVGDEFSCRGSPYRIMNAHWPIRSGQIENWNDVEKLIHHSFYNELREEHSVLITEEADVPDQGREKLCSIMFETFNIRNLCLASRPTLSMLASLSAHPTSVSSESGTEIETSPLTSLQKATGVVVLCGATSCRATPVLWGKTLSYCHQNSHFGGNDLTSYLLRLLNDRGHEMTTRAEREIARDIKEKLCFVKSDFHEYFLRVEALGGEEEMLHEYELPDGSKVSICDERIRVPQALLEPCLMGLDDDSLVGLAHLVHQAIQPVPADFHEQMYSNICISGGGSMFDGLPEQLEQEVRVLAPRGTNVNVVAIPGRKFSVWLGGALLTRLPEMDHLWVKMSDYDEIGACGVCRGMKL